MMSAKFVLLLSVVFIINEVNCKCSEGQNENACSTLRCANPEPCPIGQVLVEADPKNCICCRRCEPEKSCSDFGSSERYGCKNGETPETCYAIECYPLVESDCEKGQHYVQSDHSKCICCDHCADDCTS